MEGRKTLCLAPEFSQNTQSIREVLGELPFVCPVRLYRYPPQAFLRWLVDRIQIDGDTDEISLLDSNLNTYSNLYDLINSGLETGFYELPPTEKEVFVDRDTFIKTNSDRLPFLKIRGTRAEYSVSRSSEVHKFERDDFPEYVLKNLHDDTSHLFSKQRKIIE